MSKPQPAPDLGGRLVRGLDWLKHLLPLGSGDGKLLFDDAQLRAAHPGFAEAAITYRDAGVGRGPFSSVKINEAQPDVVRLSRTFSRIGDDWGRELLYGQSLGRRALYLFGAPLKVPIARRTTSTAVPSATRSCRRSRPRPPRSGSSRTAVTGTCGSSRP